MSFDDLPFDFAWPWALLLLLAPLLVLLVRWWLLRRRTKITTSVASISVVRAAQPGGHGWRRWLPAALLLASLASMAIGAARPQLDKGVPRSRTSIILAMDVSLSMCSVDVSPNRLAVAQGAARTFVENQDEGTRIGIVAFGGTSELVVAPTDDTVRLTEAVDGFRTSLGTGIGNAILRSVDAIAEVNPDVPPAGLNLNSDGAANPDQVADIVVLLTDGANSQGVDPVFAAERAAERGVRVYTIGFGSDQIAEMICDPTQIGGDGFGDRFGGPTQGPTGADLEELRPFLVLDEGTLQQVASLTGGEYFRAEDAGSLLNVFDALPTQLDLVQEEVEVSWYFAAAAAFLLMFAIGLGALWNAPKESVRSNQEPQV